MTTAIFCLVREDISPCTVPLLNAHVTSRQRQAASQRSSCESQGQKCHKCFVVNIRHGSITF